MSFTKIPQKFIDYLDAVIEAELDLETTIHQGYKKLDEKSLTVDFARTKKAKKEFFDWFTLLIDKYQKKK